MIDLGINDNLTQLKSGNQDKYEVVGLSMCTSDSIEEIELQRVLNLQRFFNAIASIHEVKFRT